MKPDGAFPRYQEYKDSGIEWLGSIPRQWEVKRIKHCADMRLSNVDKHLIEGDEPVILCNYVDVYRNETITSTLKFMRSTATSEQIKRLTLRKDDVIITKDSESPNDIGVPSIVQDTIDRLVCGYHLALLRPTVGSGSFLKYFIMGHYCRSSFAACANGLTRYAIGKDEINTQPVLQPHPREQRAIAFFLDCETAKIDTLIEKQQRLITLLTEKRQAFISHAVTKGLDPDAPMKDGGIEWFGKVPEHWEVKRLKFYLANINAGPFGSSLTKDVYVSEGYRVYGQEQVIPDNFEIGDYFISKDAYQDLKQYAVNPGDVLISCVGTFGKIAVVPDGIKPGIINPRLIRMRCAHQADPQFLALLLRSTIVSEQFSYLSRGGTMDIINIGILKEIVVVLPPMSEQKATLSRLRDETMRIDTLIAKANKSIDLMKERRSALISAAVTGKIDVRQVA